MGNIIAKAASSNAAGWISSKYGDGEEEIVEAGKLGSDGEDCQKIYNCDYATQRKGVLQHMFLIMTETVRQEFNLPLQYFKHTNGL